MPLRLKIRGRSPRAAASVLLWPRNIQTRGKEGRGLCCHCKGAKTWFESAQKPLPPIPVGIIHLDSRSANPRTAPRRFATLWLEDVSHIAASHISLLVHVCTCRAFFGPSINMLFQAMATLSLPSLLLPRPSLPHHTLPLSRTTFGRHILSSWILPSSTCMFESHTLATIEYAAKVEDQDCRHRSKQAWLHSQEKLQQNLRSTDFKI